MEMWGQATVAVSCVLGHTACGDCHGHNHQNGIQRNHSSLYHVGLVTFTHLSTCVNSWNVYMNRYGKYSIITQYFSNAHIYDEYNLFGINL